MDKSVIKAFIDANPNNPWLWYNASIEHNVSPSEIDAAMGWEAGTSQSWIDQNVVTTTPIATPTPVVTEPIVTKEVTPTIEEDNRNKIDLSIPEPEPVVVVPKQEEASILQPITVDVPKVTDDQIREFISTPGRTEKEIYDAAIQYGVDSTRIETVMGWDQGIVDKTTIDLGLPLIDEHIPTGYIPAITMDMSGIDNIFTNITNDLDIMKQRLSSFKTTSQTAKPIDTRGITLSESDLDRRRTIVSSAYLGTSRLKTTGKNKGL